jgi:hypothetical protein
VPNIIEEEDVEAPELVWGPFVGNRPTIFCFPARSLLTIPTALPRLQLHRKYGGKAGGGGGRLMCLLLTSTLVRCHII